MSAPEILRRLNEFASKNASFAGCVLAASLFPWNLAAVTVESEARGDFQWFGTLGFPDVKGCPFVRVATGRWSQSGDEPPQNHYIKGFLLATNGDAFTVLGLDLLKATLTNSSSGIPDHERIGFEVLRLDAEALALRKALQEPPGKNEVWRRFGEQTSEQVEVFTLAWGCWRQGLETEAQLLYDLARTVPARRGGHNQEPTFRQSIEKDLGHTMMWRGILDFEDVSISRLQLLDEFEKILKDYPHSEHRDRAQKTAEVLKRMIAEDQVHKTVGSNDLVRLPVDDQVKELIFQLRDQNGHQFSQPGWCDIFEDWRGTTNTPAHRLVALGYAAVPQLIAALDSDTLSRSVGYHRNFYFSHTVLTVGDCASQILQRITGRSLLVGRVPKEGREANADRRGSCSRERRTSTSRIASAKISRIGCCCFDPRRPKHNEQLGSSVFGRPDRQPPGRKRDRVSQNRIASWSYNSNAGRSRLWPASEQAG
jgi:hypothetical protein